jgi:hypothetical protein
VDYRPEVEAIFIGGPQDGERKVLRTCNPAPVIYVFEYPIGLFYESRHPELTLKPYIREYKHVATTPNGVAVYECEPLRCRHHFSVEVETAQGADIAQTRKVLNDLLKHIDGHHEAFPSGIVSAEVVDD